MHLTPRQPKVSRQFLRLIIAFSIQREGPLDENDPTEFMCTIFSDGWL